jgi:NADPH:quinone reductase-like Zn-dependent oxidoreductase
MSQNPTDFKHLDIEGAGLPGSVLGLDFCGTVVSTGDQVSSLKTGDRVASAVHGGKFSDKGSYAQYLKVAADMCWKVPDSVPGDSAATFGTAYITAAQVSCWST